ncbi:MAG: hypothetical protein IPJ89_00570 [Candidatus Iainarchaeum archaeon]|uniref:Uncharacterized protein n=1 Tax=Candidatus Iainarchaeum sp. TaxID=3101447 RepID=A0A7T9I2G1_9ARCH|nr:MAG: hypothetical protein IPJ89_00570 [Candidatus Diapherotrites archaeon]
MPRTIGGAKLRKKIHPFGNDIAIQRQHQLGSGAEGTAHAVRVTISGKENRSIGLVEKEFNPRTVNPVLSWSVTSKGPNLMNPRAQFALIEKLIKRNREEKLGLRFPATVRLVRKNDGTFSLLMTKLAVVDPYKLDWEKQDQYVTDALRQEEILKKAGYRVPRDCFFCVQDPTTHDVRAVIADFGTLAYNQKKNKK